MQKSIGVCFASPSQSSSSLYSSTSGGTTSTTDIKGDATKNYLPSILSNRKAENVGAIDLHFTKLPDGRCLYTYSVEWKENIKDAAEAQKEESDFSEMLKLDRLDQLSGKENEKELLKLERLDQLSGKEMLKSPRHAKNDVKYLMLEAIDDTLKQLPRAAATSTQQKSCRHKSKKNPAAQSSPSICTNATKKKQERPTLSELKPLVPAGKEALKKPHYTVDQYSINSGRHTITREFFSSEGTRSISFKKT
jgi:hypothetical protein